MAKVEIKKSKNSFPCRLARDLNKNKFLYCVIYTIVATNVAKTSTPNVIYINFAFLLYFVILKPPNIERAVR